MRELEIQIDVGERVGQGVRFGTAAMRELEIQIDVGERVGQGVRFGTAANSSGD